MSNAAKLKKKAVELEQKKQLDKALALYIQFLQESDGVIDDVDVPLYNRVGDLLLRTGNASDALNYYEKAVDLYAERGFLNNAIALCNKVLRQSPGRASIYYKLGKISASKGFKSDAKKNFLEYADRMQKAGQIDEAFRALKEFADLCPDQDDIRLMLAEQLTKENRQDEALEQLQKLHDKLDREGRTVEARATVDRMKSIDPEAVPRTSGSYRPQKSVDLIFLDTSFEQNAGQQKAPAPAARAPRQPDPAPAPPPGRQVSDPDLVVLTLADQPDAPVSPAHTAAISGTFDLDLEMPNVGAGAPVELPMLDVDAGLGAFASATDIGELAATGETATPDMAAIAPLDFDMAGAELFSLAPDTPAVVDLPSMDTIPTLDINAEPDPAPVGLIDERPAYVSGPPLAIDYASDLAADVALPVDDDGGLFDFRAPPRSDTSEPIALASLTSLDPDVAFPSFDLDDTSLPSADEIESGASLAAALGDELGLEPAQGFDAPAAIDVHGATAEAGDVIVADEARLAPNDTRPGAGSAEALDMEWPAMESSAPAPPGDAASPADIDSLELDGDTPAPAVASVHETTTSEFEIEPPTEAPRPVTIDDDVIAGDIVAGPTDVDAADPTPVPDVDAVSIAAKPPEAVEPAAPLTDIEVAVAPRRETPDDVAATANEPVAPHEAPPHDRRAGWEVQREHAEHLLEAGDRPGGVRELEQVAAELERIGDLERSLMIIDELIRLTPDSVRHHQKRVELAFRSNHRVKLIDAYLELGDALFRSGEERKARAVYHRVLELAPDDPRAIAAVESVASMSPPMGSGAIPTITPAAVTPESRPAAPAGPRENHVPYQPGPNQSGRLPGGVSAPPPSRKPSPLDRSAATSDFVDLGEWLRSGESPKSTRMVAEEKPPTGDEQADFQEMLKRFKQGVAENVEEEDYESHYDLGVAYKEMGLVDEAVAEFQKALRGTSNRTRTYEALGQCFMEKEQFHVAASVLSRAVALGEGDDHHLVGVLYLLGRATEALSKSDAALDYYQRVFAVDIEFRDVAERISAIERKAT
ncbi:MAG TPA: tetratricopeptide repeat protein [Gemmatimonadaceae bacterium]|nr:tetratricopeptide repeat protein [Gemmatimonadaceae bacterium]